MNELVARLSQGEHPVEAQTGSSGDAKALQERIQLGLVHVRFTGTRGGTELGVRLDLPACDLSQADFAAATGRVVLQGHLTLNGDRVICRATIELPGLQGVGQLIPV